MGQGPIATQISGLNPSGVAVPLKCDAAGKLLVADTSDGLSYVNVAASQTAQALGTGAIGDVLASITYTPDTTAAGVVTIIDGSGGGAVSIPLFIGGGTTALTNLQPVTIPLNLVSAVGGWHVTTGANITVVAVGKFTP